MKIVKIGKYDISDLEVLKEIQPFNHAKNIKHAPLPRLNYFLGFLKRNRSEILPDFVANLTSKLGSLVKKDCLTKKTDELSKLYIEMPNLAEYPELVSIYLNYCFQLLQLDQNVDWVNDRVKVINRNYSLSFLHHRYYIVLALTETIERDEAIQLYKNYLTEYVKSRAPPTFKRDKLEEGRESAIQRDIHSPDIGWEIILGKIENGKFPQRKDTCMWADVLKDLPDVELKYLAACYGDFQGYNNPNENFILTMEHTIIEGDPYCSCVVHDTRINNDLTHPSKEFVDNRWPLEE